MKKYRARWDGNGEYNKGSCWLTDDAHIHVYSEKAAVGSLGETVNRIAQMALNEPATVRDGRWVLERKRKGWIPVR